MSFTMKSKISSSFSLSLSFPPSVCPSPSYSFCNPPGPAPSRTPACFASLLRSSPHPTVCPSRRVEIARQLGCPTRLDFYYCDLPLLQNTLELYYRAMDVGNLRWRWPHTLLPAGRYPSNWSSPPTPTLILLLLLFSWRLTLTASFFNTLVFFLTEKTFQRQPEASLPFLS